MIREQALSLAQSIVPEATGVKIQDFDYGAKWGVEVYFKSQGVNHRYGVSLSEKTPEAVQDAAQMCRDFFVKRGFLSA